MEKVQSTYDRFWELLMVGIPAAAGTDFEAAIVAVNRLRKIEYGPDGTGGQTGYVNGQDPAKAALDYLKYEFDNGPAPDWLVSAERGQ